jgi:catechol 2,3-dioxygenase-like lactoylglutathione lyase family enzyme
MPPPSLFRHHFQVAYVVRDLDAACASFERQWGVAKWYRLPLPEGQPVRKLALAYVQELMIELIEPDPTLPSIYRDWIPASPDAARFHHLGYLIDDAEEFRQTVQRLDAAGCEAAMAGRHGDLQDYHYADTVAAFGHYTELIHLLPAGRGFFDAVPRN